MDTRSDRVPHTPAGYRVKSLRATMLRLYENGDPTTILKGTGKNPLVDEAQHRSRVRTARARMKKVPK